MKYVFVGDPKDDYSGPNQVTVKGIKFVKNRPVHIKEEMRPFFDGHDHFLTKPEAEKLYGNHHEDDVPDPETPEVVYDIPDPETPEVVDDIPDPETPDFDTMKVDELREYCTENNIDFSTSDTKKVLIQAIVDHQAVIAADEGGE